MTYKIFIKYIYRTHSIYFIAEIAQIYWLNSFGIFEGRFL